jgi:cell division protein FtsZ
VDISTATGVLINVIGGPDMTLAEAQRVVEEVQKRVSESARIIWGAAIDPSFEKRVEVMIVAVGVKSKQILGKLTSEELKKAYGVDVIK